MNSPVTYRRIQPGDNKPLADIIRSVFREFKINKPGTVYTDPTTDHLYEVFQTKGSTYFVAEENGIMIGGCGIYPTTGLPEGCVELVKFFLTASARGKGTGQELMHKSMEAAKELGYKQMYLETFPELSKAVSIYEREGFKNLDHAMGNSGHYACNIWMLKEL
ncbi:MAG: GNAT family N-acetyltransferase [Bacteroidia bacterium]